MKISVIIPTYNREQTIRRCLQSVLNQTSPVNEIIIVDDCSKDKTCEIILQMYDERIRLIQHYENKGAQAARNTGIKEATGEWIAFLDSDDTWEPEKIEKQVLELRKYEFDPYIVVHSDGYIVKGDESSRQLYNLPFIEGTNAHLPLLKHPGPTFQSMLTSKKALEEINLLDEKVVTHQEWDTAIRLAQKCRFIHIKEPLFSWYIHEGKTISSNKQNHALGYEYIIRKFEDEIKTIDHGYWWDNHLKALIVKKVNAGNRESAATCLKEFLNKAGLEYYVSRLIVRSGVSKDISVDNLLLRVMYKAWRVRHKLTDRKWQTEKEEVK